MTPAGHVLASRAEDDLVKSINTALETPGVAVTTFDINRFAERDGAIDKLRAEGVQVTEPAD